MNIVAPVLTLGGLGVIFGAGLALAAKKFCVVGDPRLEKIYAKLPGANCGVCGMPGCIGFAEALIQGACTPDRCVVMEEEARKKVSEIMGIEHKKKVKNTAVLHCHGGSKRVKNKFIYIGEKDCVAANLVMAGPKACVYGCIGYGSCTRACPFGAITMNEEDLPVVNEDKCTACAKCAAICPKNLYTIAPITKTYAVRCMSRDFGKEVMDVCSVGCIACGKCEKACPTGAIKVIDNLAVIDYHSCDNRGSCFVVCPVKTIAKKEHKHWIGKI